MTVAISLISAGAPQSGVMECINVYRGITGVGFNEVYMTSTEIKGVMESNDMRPDILIAPVMNMEEFRSAGLLDVSSLTRVGDVNVGVAVRRVIVGSSSISPSLSSPSSEVSLVCTPEGLLAVPTALFSTLPLSTACWSIV